MPERLRMTSQMAGNSMPSRQSSAAVEAQLDGAARDVADVGLVVGVALDDLQVLAVRPSIRPGGRPARAAVRAARRSACSRRRGRPCCAFHARTAVKAVVAVELLGAGDAGPAGRRRRGGHACLQTGGRFSRKASQALDRVVRAPSARRGRGVRGRRARPLRTRSKPARAAATAKRRLAAERGSEVRASPGERGRGRVVGQLVDEAQRERLLGADGAAGQAAGPRRAAADALGQDQRRDRGEDAEPDLGLAEVRVRRGEDAVADAGQLEAAAQALAAHHGEHRDAAVDEARKQPVEAASMPATLRAGAPRTLAPKEKCGPGPRAAMAATTGRSAGLGEGLRQRAVSAASRTLPFEPVEDQAPERAPSSSRSIDTGASHALRSWDAWVTSSSSCTKAPPAKPLDRKKASTGTSRAAPSCARAGRRRARKRRAGLVEQRRSDAVRARPGRRRPRRSTRRAASRTRRRAPRRAGSRHAPWPRACDGDARPGRGPSRAGRGGARRGRGVQYAGLRAAGVVRVDAA